MAGQAQGFDRAVGGRVSLSKDSSHEPAHSPGYVTDGVVGSRSDIHTDSRQLSEDNIESGRASLRRSVTFEEPLSTISTGDSMAGGSRKRNNRRDARERQGSGEGEGLSSADESAPIIRHSQQNAKDYQSISPSISARDHQTTKAKATDTDGRTQQEGTTGILAGGTPQDRTRSAERRAADVERKEGGNWRKWVEKYGSVELENKGSVARDHLALERTFLAWLRTSLSFASIGIAVTQLFRLNTSIGGSDPSSSPSTDTPQARLRHVGKPLGATFVGISIVILFIGFHRYFEAQHYVIRGKFPASRGSILVVSLVAGALILSSLVVILAVAPHAFET